MSNPSGPDQPDEVTDEVTEAADGETTNEPEPTEQVEPPTRMRTIQTPPPR